MAALAIELDPVLGDTRALWDDWLEDTGRRARVDLTFAGERAQAGPALDAALGNWRELLERFAEDRAPVYLRPDAGVGAALRQLAAAGTRLGVFTDAPEPLARVALAHLGAARRVEALETGPDALERLLERLGEGTAVVRSRAELITAAA